LLKDRLQGNKMSTVSKECHVLGDALQLGIEEASLRKQKLEQALRAVDAASSHLIETAARQEIEAYKRRHQSPSAIVGEIRSRLIMGASYHDDGRAMPPNEAVLQKYQFRNHQV
jgi:hypothetical protein